MYQINYCYCYFYVLKEPNNKEKQKKLRKNELSSRYKFTNENESNICRNSSEVRKNYNFFFSIIL